MTHSHFDHCSGVATSSPSGWELTYPDAIHILKRLDYPTARTGSGVVFEILHSAAEWGRLKLLSGEYQVTDGVRLLPAPGETPGHMVVDVHSVGKRFIYAGDLFHLPFELEHIGMDSGGSKPRRDDQVADVGHRPGRCHWSIDDIHPCRLSGQGYVQVDQPAACQVGCRLTPCQFSSGRISVPGRWLRRELTNARSRAECAGKATSSAR